MGRNCRALVPSFAWLGILGIWVRIEIRMCMFEPYNLDLRVVEVTEFLVMMEKNTAAGWNRMCTEFVGSSFGFVWR